MTSVRNNAVTFITGWFIFAFFTCIVLCEQAASTKAINDNVDDNMPASDYNYSDEESPEQMKAPPKIVSTAKPYFDEKNKSIYIKEGNKVSLDCPAKNYNESHHQILWFKDGKLITNGKNILSNVDVYQLDQDLNLIMMMNEETKGDYYCTIMPQNVSRHIHVDFGELPPSDAENQQPMIKASTLCIAALILVREIVVFANMNRTF